MVRRQRTVVWRVWCWCCFLFIVFCVSCLNGVVVSFRANYPANMLHQSDMWQQQAWHKHQVITPNCTWYFVCVGLLWLILIWRNGRMREIESEATGDRENELSHKSISNESMKKSRILTGFFSTSTRISTSNRNNVTNLIHRKIST